MRLGPVVVLGDGGLLVVWRTGPRVIHLQEQEIGELLDLFAVGDTVVAEQVAVVPDFVDEIGGGGRHRAWSSFEFSVGRGDAPGREGTIPDPS
jgi:hypothetical protein